MSPLKIVLPILLIAIFIPTASSTQSGSSTVPAAPTATQTLLPTPTPLPTPSSPSNSILWDNLQVSMDQLEITNGYITDFGSARTPTDGKKFLWVHVRLKNKSQIEMDVPAFEHYSILYAAIEIKPIYGHRNGYVEYTTLGKVIFPNQELDSWLRFEIPSTAELRDIRFVFLPESAQAGVFCSASSYPSQRMFGVVNPNPENLILFCG